MCAKKQKKFLLKDSEVKHLSSWTLNLNKEGGSNGE